MKRLVLVVWWIVVLVTGGALSSAGAATDPATTSVLVKLVAGLSAEEQAAVISRDGGVETSAVAALRLHAVSIPTAEVAAVLQRYQSDAQVESVELNKSRKAEGVPVDSEYGVQWALAKIGWESVYGTLTPAGTATVAILDTGIDASHPDLSGSVSAGTSILDGSNGLSDPNGHGTSLAGIVAATTGNGTGIAGIGYAGVRVLPVTVLDARGVGQDSDIISGIMWAADHGADVILMGFSNPDFSLNLQDAIDYAWNKGAVVVSATGNDGAGTPTFPAGNRGVIGVSATDQSDSLAPGSNYGAAVFLAAPGVDIYTTAPGGGYSYISGTSASSAVVAGAAGLLKAVDPSLSNGIVVGRLAKSADAVGTAGDPASETFFGNGRVNLANALAATSTDAVQPAGAAPVGSGGPYVGPYRAASSATISGVIKSAATGMDIPDASIACTLGCNTDILISMVKGHYTLKGTFPRSQSSIMLEASAPGFLSSSKSVAVTAQNEDFQLTPKNEQVTVTLGNLTPVYDGKPKPVSVTTAKKTSGDPVAVAVQVLYGDSTTAPTDAGSYPVTARVVEPGYEGTATATLVIKKATAEVLVESVTYTYDATAKAAVVTTKPAGLQVDISYQGIENKPVAAQSYTVLATVNDKNYEGSATGTLIINPAKAKVTLQSASPTYDGTEKTATVTTVPEWVQVGVTYNGSLTAPRDAGSYSVVATVSDPNYEGGATGTLEIKKATATVTLSDLQPAYDGTPKAVTVATTPPGLSFSATYDDSVTAPTNAGPYRILAVVTDGNYTGSTTGTMMIQKAKAKVSLKCPQPTYDGTPKSATISTEPLGLTVRITYDEIATAPTKAGTYAVAATVQDANYVGEASGELVINKAAAALKLEGLSATYDGTPKAAAATVAPAGLTVSITYNGSAAAPVAAGSYAVSAEIDDQNYAGSASGTLVIGKATPTVNSWPTASVIVSGQTLRACTLTGGSATVSGSYRFTNLDAVMTAGTSDQEVTFTPDDSANYLSVKGTVPVKALPPCAAPLSVSVPASNTTGVFNVGWSNSRTTGATYQLQYSTDGKTWTTAYNGAWTSATVPVTANGHYQFRVKATKPDYADSSFTTSVGSCAVTLTCRAPASISFPAGNTTGTFTVAWSNSDVSGAQYELQYSPDGVNWIPSYSGPWTSATVTVTASANYSFRVKATKAGYADSGFATSSGSCNVTLTCGRIASITVPATSSTGTFSVSWTNSDVTGVQYELEYSSDNGSHWTPAYSGAWTSATVTVPNGSYVFQVRATRPGYDDSGYTTSTTCQVTKN